VSEVAILELATSLLTVEIKAAFVPPPDRLEIAVSVAVSVKAAIEVIRAVAKSVSDEASASELVEVIDAIDSGDRLATSGMDTTATADNWDESAMAEVSVRATTPRMPCTAEATWLAASLSVATLVAVIFPAATSVAASLMAAVFMVAIMLAALKAEAIDKDAAETWPWLVPVAARVTASEIVSA
jgi:hypothetical protein